MLKHHGCANEILDAPRAFALLKGGRDGNLPIDLNARRPKLVVHMYGGESNRLNRIIAFRGLLSKRGQRTVRRLRYK